MIKTGTGISTATPSPLSSRRQVLQGAAAGLIAGIAAPALSGDASARAAAKLPGKTLVAYFSRTGNTRDAAAQIQQITGGTMFEIRATHAYPAEYRATTDQAKQELESNFRPQLTADVATMDSYDTVFIGYPNWWGTLPTACFTFLEKYDFSGKTLVPFCTHEGSRLGRSAADIQTTCPKATVHKGLALRGGSSGYVKTQNAQQDIAAWLRTL